MITCFIRYEIDPFKAAAFEDRRASGDRRFPPTALHAKLVQS